MKRGFDLARFASVFSNARHSRRVGAVIFAGGKLISSGHNTYGKTHPSAKNGAFNVHAELHALIKRQHYDEKNLVMYVYRELANGAPACSMPCPNCMFLMQEAGVKSVHFVNVAGEQEKIKL